MKIGVISDTHNNLSNMIFGLNTFQEEGIDTIIHCGDLTDLDMVAHLAEFRVIFAFGNMDYATGAIKGRLMQMREDNYAGMIFRGDLSGISIAVTHSHIDGILMELVRENHYQWLFHGHTHEKRDEVVQGVRIVNPGALGGMGREPHSFCIVDLDAEDVRFVQLP